MSNIKVEIITIGDEILYGQILDTNAQWISEILDKHGFKVIKRTTIGDVEDEILNCLALAEKSVDIVLITGGLGPTADDLTKPTMAKYFNSPIKRNIEAFKGLENLFKKANLELTDTNIAQTDLPENCQVIMNTVGTAPGMWFDERDTVFVSMPGVPFEMKKMMRDIIVPRLIEHFKPDSVYHKVIKTIGIGESWLSDKIMDWEKQLPSDIGLAYLPSLGQVKLRLTTFGQNQEVLEKNIEHQINKLKPIIGHHIYGYGKDEIEAVIGAQLKSLNMDIATAESCTGGYISHAITSIPGSSEYFKGSVVAYHNEIKERQLGVKKETLEKYGAVSEQTVTEMAKGLCTLFGTRVAIATSGIAGPDGGTKEKPVGTIWIAIVIDGHVVTKKLSLWKERVFNIKTTATYALSLLWQSLKENR